MDYGAGGAVPDPALAVLDGNTIGKGKRRRHRKNATAKAREEFDLAALDLANSGASPLGVVAGLADSSTRSATSERRRVRTRATRSRRREIVATVAVAALVMLLVLMLGLTGSCSVGPEAF